MHLSMLSMYKFNHTCLHNVQDYGHPCSGGQQQEEEEEEEDEDDSPSAASTAPTDQEQGLTAEQFIRLFIH